MSWDPALLRKYNSTNHFKLLNQVRSDLKEQPIQRTIPAPRQESRSDSRSDSRPEPRQDSRQEFRQDSAPAPSRRSGGRGEGSGRRRSAPAPVPVISSTPANSFDPIVTVPVLTDVFTDH